MKYIGQCLVNFLDHTNVPNFHSSKLDGNTIAKKIKKKVKLKQLKQNDSRFFLNSLMLKKNY